MTQTIEQEAMALVNETITTEHFRVLPQYVDKVVLCRALEDLRAEREANAATKAEFEAFRQEVSDAVEHYLDQWRDHTPSREVFTCQFAHFIIPKPDPLVEALDAMLRRRTLNPAAEVVADEAAWLRAALAARGLKLVEAGDAD